MAANILCKDTINKFLHASPSVAEIYMGEVVVKFAKRKHNSLKLADESYGFWWKSRYIRVLQQLKKKQHTIITNHEYKRLCKTRKILLGSKDLDLNV